MLVSEYFTKLSYGQFRNVSAGLEGIGQIKDETKNTIVGYMQDALIQLYTRFNLLEKVAIVQQHSHITNYHLDKRYAKFNPDRPPENYGYIIDLPAEAFNNDAVKILRVHDMQGCERVLNDTDDCYGYGTPFSTTLFIPNPVNNEYVSIVYQALHPKLEFGVYNTPINIPNSLDNAFLTYVAYSFYRDMNTDTTSVKSQEHLAAYEMICAKLEETGNSNNSNVSSVLHKFARRGFI